MSNLLSVHQSQIEKICQEKDIDYLALFGSYSRGDQKLNSDIDLLVRYSKPVGLLHHAQSQIRFEELFQKPVDLVSTKAVHPLLKPYIESDIQVIYEKNTD